MLLVSFINFLHNSAVIHCQILRPLSQFDNNSLFHWKDARKQIQTKLAEKLKDKEAKITKKEEEISGLREEVHGLKEKMSAKVSQLESLHSEEVEVYRQKYQECQQQLVTLK